MVLMRAAASACWTIISSAMRSVPRIPENQRNRSNSGVVPTRIAPTITPANVSAVITGPREPEWTWVDPPADQASASADIVSSVHPGRYACGVSVSALSAATAATCGVGVARVAIGTSRS